MNSLIILYNKNKSFCFILWDRGGNRADGNRKKKPSSLYITEVGIDYIFQFKFVNFGGVCQLFDCNNCCMQVQVFVKILSVVIELRVYYRDPSFAAP